MAEPSLPHWHIALFWVSICMSALSRSGTNRIEALLCIKRIKLQKDPRRDVHLKLIHFDVFTKLVST